MKIGIILAGIYFDFDYLIGVEKGALDIINAGKTLDLAIGDFDSISSSDKKIIFDNAKKVIEFSSIKDDTDTTLAVKEAKKLSNDITICGGIKGNRIEHFISNLFLVNNYDVKIIDDNSKIYKIEVGTYDFVEKCCYVSFFALEESIITLNNFFYPLDNYHMKMYDSLGISNKPLKNAKAIVKKGKILVIESNLGA